MFLSGLTVCDEKSWPWGTYESGVDTTVNLSQRDSRATVKFLQVGSTSTKICVWCEILLNKNKELQLKVEAHGIYV
jgi:hypothetical protein